MKSKMPKRIIIIRHGETEHNRTKIWQGWTDVPLNKTGIQQARLAGKKLESENIDILYCSDLLRAESTAGEICKFLQLSPVTTKQLRERFMGEMEGKQVDSIDPKYREMLENVFDHSNENYKGHQGETTKELKERIGSFIDYLKQNYKGKTVALVTHGGTTISMLRMLIGDGLERVPHFRKCKHFNFRKTKDKHLHNY